MAAQIVVILEGAAWEEVAFDPLHQAFDAALLVARAQVTGLGMKAKVTGQLEQRLGPERLVSSIPAAGDRLHIIEDEDPRNPAESEKAVREAAEQRLLTHIGGEADPTPARVLEATGQKIAGGRLLLTEGKLTNLTPIDLQIFSREAFKAERDISGKAVAFEPDPTNHILEDAAAAGLGVVRIGAGEFQHTHGAQALLQPQLDLRSVGIHLGSTSALGRSLVDGFMQGALNSGAGAAEFFGDLPLTLAAFGQQLDRRAFHLP